MKETGPIYPDEAFEPAEEAIELQEIKNFPIAELEQPAQKLLQQLRPEIDQGKYQIIIGEDASGRIPALVFNKVLSEIYERRGFKKPSTFFIPGGVEKDKTVKERSTEIEQQLDLLLKRHQAQFQEHRAKILIVTEAVYSGRGVAPLAAALHEKGFDFDIAAVGVEYGDFAREVRKEHEQEWGTTIYYGMLGTPEISGQHYLGGVVKNRGDKIAKPYPKAPWAIGHKMPDVESAREDVAILSRRLAAWYQKTSVK